MRHEGVCLQAQVNFIRIFTFSCCIGDDSGKVTIWNMAPVKNEEDEMNENVPKLLCHMDNHLGGFSYACTYTVGGI